MKPGQFELDGFTTIAHLLDESACQQAVSALAPEIADGPGRRDLLESAWCRSLATTLRGCPGLAAVVPAAYVAVQCSYFEKSSALNWLVPLHQDLSIPVAARVCSDALHGWSEKDGMLFVQPPVTVLDELVALRVHLDDCHADDGALQVLPRSHTEGRIAHGAAGELRRRRSMVVCELRRGDALAMRPLILHASTRARGASRRRVLHFLFGPGHLPFGLKWRHAV